MALKKYRPLSPDPYVNKLKGDTEFARLAHLNDLVNQVQAEINGISPTTYTPGSVLFTGPSGSIAEDPLHFKWDSANNRLGIGTNAPTYNLDIIGTVKVAHSSNSSSLYFTATNGGLSHFYFENLSTASAAGTGLRFANNTGLNTQIFLASTTGTINPNRFVFDALNTTAISLQSRGGNIDLVTGGNGPTNSKLRVFLNGNTAIGTNSTDSGNKFQTYGTGLIQGSPSAFVYSQSVLTVKNMNTAGQNTYGLITLDNNVSSLSYADIRLGTNPTGLRLYATDIPGAIATGAAIQMFRNTDPNFPGQVYFDSGSNNSGALIFRTAPASTGLTERVRVKSNGSVRFQPMTQPATAEAGDVYYDSGTNRLRCYNGTIWNDLF